MARIRHRDTAPEIQIRRLLHNSGFRFRLHRRDLPGTPDIVLPRYKAIVDVRGCYWHAHDCHLFRRPTGNAEFWQTKLLANLQRDARTGEALTALGWRQLVVWECALKGKTRLGLEDLSERILSWILSDSKRGEIQGGEAKAP